MLIFLDLETTGLDEQRCDILEIAAIAVDDRLQEQARWSAVLHHGDAQVLSTVDPADKLAVCDASDTTGIDPYVVKMHLANGLWSDSAAAVRRASRQWTAQINGIPAIVRSADDGLANFIVAVSPETGEKRGPQLAGSTISFDRAFLKRHLPRAHALLSYRNLDVTSLNELARRMWPILHEKRPGAGGEPAHRAMADVEQSLEMLRYYAAKLGPISETEDATCGAIAGWIQPSDDSDDRLVRDILQKKWKR